MTTYPQVSFVEGPSEPAVTRFDMNTTSGAATCRVEHDSFSLGAPPLLGEPDSVSAALGLRSAGWVLEITGTKANAYDVRTSVSRELLRPENWVRIKLDASSPVHYMKTYRSDLQALDLQYVKNGSGSDTWRLPVSLWIEPLLYQERVTIPTTQIVQSPADLTGPTRYAMHYTLPAIQGDAPTSLRVTLAPASPYGGAGVSWAIGCIAGESTMADPVADIGTSDGFTAFTGTSGGTSGSGYFNGSYRTVTIGAGEALINRLSGPLPDLPVGRYKVALRYEADGSTSDDRTYLFQWQTLIGFGGAGLFPNDVRQVAIPADPSSGPDYAGGWVDLGEFTYPANAGAFEETPIGQPAPASGQTYFQLWMTTAEGVAGSVRLDALKFIPVGGPTVSRSSFLAAEFSHAWFPMYDTSGGTKAIAGTFDGDTESYWATAVAPTSPTGLMPGVPQLSGSFPVADPNAEKNLLVIMAMDAGLSFFRLSTLPPLTTVKDAELALDVSYHPRKLHI